MSSLDAQKEFLSFWNLRDGGKISFVFQRIPEKMLFWKKLKSNFEREVIGGGGDLSRPVKGDWPVPRTSLKLRCSFLEPKGFWVGVFGIFSMSLVFCV